MKREIQRRVSGLVGEGGVERGTGRDNSSPSMPNRQETGDGVRWSFETRDQTLITHG